MQVLMHTDAPTTPMAPTAQCTQSQGTTQPSPGRFLADPRPHSPPTVVLSAVASSGSCRAVTQMTMWPCASSRTRPPLRSTWSSWWAACRPSRQWWARLCRSSTRCPQPWPHSLLSKGQPLEPRAHLQLATQWGRGAAGQGGGRCVSVRAVGQGCGQPGRRQAPMCTPLPQPPGPPALLTLPCPPLRPAAPTEVHRGGAVSRRPVAAAPTAPAALPGAAGGAGPAVPGPAQGRVALPSPLQACLQGRGRRPDAVSPRS